MTSRLHVWVGSCALCIALLLPSSSVAAEQKRPPATEREAGVGVVPETNPGHAAVGVPQDAPVPSTSAVRDVAKSLPKQRPLTPSDSFASHNLRPVNPGPNEAKQLELAQIKLEQGRQYRLSGAYPMAEQALTNLMNMAAPAEFHRAAMLELGMVAHDMKHYARAQQIYSQYVNLFKEDQSVPEVLLRQGLLYREMGATTLALAKFYGVMSAALSLKLDKLTYYQRLVLQAQTEIADTYYLEAKFPEAIDYYKRLLKLESQDLNREAILFKLVRSCAGAGLPSDTIVQAKQYEDTFAESEHLAEICFLQSEALKQLGRKEEAIQVVLALVTKQRSKADLHHDQWNYWQQRTGNELANELYQQGDFLNALEIYKRLGELNVEPRWRMQSWYQAGLIFERLKQSQKAGELYDRIMESGKGLEEPVRTPALNTIVDMARWRKERMGWQAKAEDFNRELSAAKTAASSATQ